MKRINIKSKQNLPWKRMAMIQQRRQQQQRSFPIWRLKLYTDTRLGARSSTQHFLHCYAAACRMLLDRSHEHQQQVIAFGYVLMILWTVVRVDLCKPVEPAHSLSGLVALLRSIQLNDDCTMQQRTRVDFLSTIKVLLL